MSPACIDLVTLDGFAAVARRVIVAFMARRALAGTAKAWHSGSEAGCLRLRREFFISLWETL